MGGVWERDGLGVRVTDANDYITEWINNKVLLYGREKCIHYPVIKHNGKK